MFAVARPLLYREVRLARTNKLFSSNCASCRLSLFSVGVMILSIHIAVVQAAGDVMQFTAITCLSLSFQKLKTGKANVLFFPTFPSFQNSIFFFYCCQSSPLCPVGKSHIMDLWWNDTDRGNGRTRARTCFSVTLSTFNLMWAGLVSTPEFVVRGRRLTACTMAPPLF